MDLQDGSSIFTINSDIRYKPAVPKLFFFHGALSRLNKTRGALMKKRYSVPLLL